MASIRITLAAILIAACGPRFDRALETRAVYDAVLTDEAAMRGQAGEQSTGVFLETVSDGEAQLTFDLRRHRQRAARVYGRWLPALADYASRRGAGRRLEDGFSAPHHVIDRADPATWPARGATWISFSAVGFDQPGRHAVVFTQRGAFQADGGDGRFLLLERTGAGWRIAHRRVVFMI